MNGIQQEKIITKYRKTRPQLQDNRTFLDTLPTINEFPKQIWLNQRNGERIELFPRIEHWTM